MRPVFANSAFVPVRRGMVQRGGGFGALRLRVRYGLWHHPVAGPVLIDTGYGLAVTEDPGRSVALRAYAALLRPQLDAQPLEFLARQGLKPRDIQTVILTHYHADHISGLSLFPKARVLGHGGVLAQIRENGWFANLRHGVFPELLPADLGQRFTAVEDLPMAAGPPEGWDLFGDGSLLGVALPGHAAGHFGLWFAAEQLLYAVDTEWVEAALAPGAQPRGPAGLVAADRTAAKDSRRFVRETRARGAKVLLCHDPAPSPYDEKGLV